MTLHPAVAAVRLGVRRELAPFLEVSPRREGDDRLRLVPGDAVLVACSGGADSLALLAATVFEGRKAGLRVIGVTVDHGLQEGSAEHAARVVAQMAALGAHETASIRVHVDVAAGGVEAGAREARYAALGQLADHFGTYLVLLGHTLNDQAETALLGLTRGSGGRSIAGMRPAFPRDDVWFHRPLLDITRAQTEAACEAEGIDFWVDPHNSDPRFLRSRVRHDVLPVLERELGPGVAETLARTAGQLRRDMEYLDEAASERFVEAVEQSAGPSEQGLGFRMGVAPLAHEAAAITTRVARLAALSAGCPASELAAVHVEALTELLTGSGRGREIQLPGRVTAYRDGGDLAFRRTTTGG